MELLEIQLSETGFSRRGQVEDCWKENTRTWLRGGRSISNGKSPSRDYDDSRRYNK
jgi:hypothetical protein